MSEATVELKPVVDNVPFSYNKNEVPASYVCNRCGAHGIKLWRDYQTFLNHQELVCADCITAEHLAKGEDQTYHLLPNGQYTWSEPNELFAGMVTDQVGWRVPAVPTEENDSMWGYTSVPREGCDWWNSLPAKQIVLK